MSAVPKRKSIRFHSTPLEIALIDIKVENTFRPTVTALVANESFTGCALVTVSETPLKKGLRLKVKIGELDPMPAVIVWVKTLDENIKKVGLEFET